MLTILVVGGAAIVLALGGYAGWLHYQLWRRKQRQASAPQVSTFEPQQFDPRRVELRKTLFVLADALLQEKMTHTEGCLRICAMANHLENNAIFRQEYGVLFVVAEATAHFPILDDWAALSKEEKRRITKEREAIESKYRDAVIEAVERIHREFR